MTNIKISDLATSLPVGRRADEPPCREASCDEAKQRGARHAPPNSPISCHPVILASCRRVASPICNICVSNMYQKTQNFPENTQLWTLITFHTGRIARCTLHQSIRRELENRMHPFLVMHPFAQKVHPNYQDLSCFVEKISISAQCKIPNLQQYTTQPNWTL